MSINLNTTQLKHNVSNRAQLSFGHKLVLDIGASDPRATVKFLDCRENGDEVLIDKGFIGEKKEGFKSTDDFLNCMAGRIKEKSDKALGLIEQLKIGSLKKKKERKLSKLVLLVPGQIVNNEALIFPNIKDTNGNSLENIDLKKLQAKLEAGGVELSKDFSIIATNDMVGCGAEIAHYLANNPEYRDKLVDGSFVAVIKPGGGFGTVDLKVKNSIVEIEKSESGHNLAVHPAEERLTRIGATAPTFIRNFARKIGLNEDQVNALIKSGKAQIVDKGVAVFDNRLESDAIKALLDSGMYHIRPDSKISDTSTVIELDKSKSENIERHKEALKFAVEELATAVSQHAISKITEGANLLVLCGPFIRGLNLSSIHKPELFDGKTLKEIVTEKIDGRADSTCRHMMQTFGFEVYIEGIEDISNNVKGGATLFDKSSRIVAPEKRSNWVNIPVKMLISGKQK